MITLRGTELVVDGTAEALDRRRKAAEIHDLVGRMHRALDGADPEGVVRLAERLVVGGTLTGRTVAYLLLGRRWGSAAGIRTRRIEALGDGIATWHHSDVFSSGVAGPGWREGRLSDAAVRRWTRSDDVLWRRNALVSTISLNARSWGGTGDVARTIDICSRLVSDPDPVVQKALSWALRTLIAVDRRAVERLLSDHDVAARVRRETRSKLDTGRKR